MSEIKDIVDLCIQLRNEVRDRKTVETISRIQTLILALQSHQAMIVEKNADLLTENFELKRKIAQIEEEHPLAIAKLKAEHEQEMVNHRENGEGFAGTVSIFPK